MSYDVFGIGNALVDIEAQVTDEVLGRLKFQKGVMTLVDEATQSTVLSGIDGAPIHRCAGGSAANTVIGVADLGGSSAYAGKVGNDDMGRFCLEDMRNMGVAIEVPPATGQTGTCVVLVTNDAQRTMLTHLGVSAELAAADIDADEIAKAKYLYVEGYLFPGESTRLAALRAIEVAKAHGVKVAFTVSDPMIINLCRDLFWDLIQGPVDLLFCNLEESRSLTGQRDPIDCAHEIHKHAEHVALTLGKDGSIIMHDGKATPVEGVAVNAVDTTGAGDMYAAGILYGITNGLTWPQAGRIASHAAARIVGQFGARVKNPFTAEQIAEWIQ